MKHKRKRNKLLERIVSTKIFDYLHEYQVNGSNLDTL